MGGIFLWLALAIGMESYYDLRAQRSPIVAILGGSTLIGFMMILKSATGQTRFFSILAFAIFAGVAYKNLGGGFGKSTAPAAKPGIYVNPNDSNGIEDANTDTSNSGSTQAAVATHPASHSTKPFTLNS